MTVHRGRRDPREGGADAVARSTSTCATSTSPTARNGVRRWNQALEDAGSTSGCSCPHEGFNRKVGVYAAHHVSPEGEVLDDATWAPAWAAGCRTTQDRRRRRGADGAGVRVRRVRRLDRAAEDRHQRPARRVRLRPPRRGGRGWRDGGPRAWPGSARRSRSGTPTSERVIGGAPEGAFVIPFRGRASRCPASGGRCARRDEGGRVLAYGRLDVGWGGDAEILLAVEPSSPGGRASAASCSHGSRRRPRRAASTTSTTGSASTSSATWCTTGWWSAASAGRWTATCASGSAARPAAPARPPRACVDAVRRRHRPGRPRAGPRGAGRVRRRGRAPLLIRSRRLAVSWPSGDRPARRDHAAHACARRRCQRACRSWKAAAARGPGPVVVEQLARQVGVEEGEAPPLLDHLRPARRTPRASSAPRGSRTRRGRRGSAPRRRRGPRPRRAARRSSPMPAVGPVQAKARSSRPRSRDDLPHERRLGGVGRDPQPGRRACRGRARSAGCAAGAAAAAASRGSPR